jgi:16S rRNA (cytidine1402-2'-O)-methyltransferase
MAPVCDPRGAPIRQWYNTASIWYFMPMPGLLSVVATPIGNLEDVTLRSLRVLRDANLIAAEDNGIRLSWLRHFGIATPTVSFHAHNCQEQARRSSSRSWPRATPGPRVGCRHPGVSDPGVELVDACRQAGIRVEPIPGASAPLAAVVASGFPMIPLTVLWFPPTRSNDRNGGSREPPR